MPDAASEKDVIVNAHVYPPKRNPFRMKREKRGLYTVAKEYEFVKGEFNLGRKMKRWLYPRVATQTSNDAVRLACRSLARMILQYHAAPKTLGREFFLCREALPSKFTDEHGPIHSEWHLRLAKAVLIKVGFIHRVTPVAEMRSNQKGVWGRWLKATKGKSGIRSPKVLFKLSTATLRLVAETLKRPNGTILPLSPVYSFPPHGVADPHIRRGTGIHTGWSPETRPLIEARNSALDALEALCRSPPKMPTFSHVGRDGRPLR